jgi:hypothetical protein
LIPDREYILSAFVWIDGGALTFSLNKYKDGLPTSSYTKSTTGLTTGSWQKIIIKGYIGKPELGDPKICQPTLTISADNNTTAYITDLLLTDGIYETAYIPADSELSSYDGYVKIWEKGIDITGGRLNVKTGNDTVYLDSQGIYHTTTGNIVDATFSLTSTGTAFNYPGINLNVNGTDGIKAQVKDTESNVIGTVQINDKGLTVTGTSFKLNDVDSIGSIYMSGSKFIAQNSSSQSVTIDPSSLDGKILKVAGGAFELTGTVQQNGGIYGTITLDQDSLKVKTSTSTTDPLAMNDSVILGRYDFSYTGPGFDDSDTTNPVFDNAHLTRSLTGYGLGIKDGNIGMCWQSEDSSLVQVGKYGIIVGKNNEATVINAGRITFWKDGTSFPYVVKAAAGDSSFNLNGTIQEVRFPNPIVGTPKILAMPSSILTYDPAYTGAQELIIGTPFPIMTGNTCYGFRVSAGYYNSGSGNDAQTKINPTGSTSVSDTANEVATPTAAEYTVWYPGDISYITIAIKEGRTACRQIKSMENKIAIYVSNPNVNNGVESYFGGDLYPDSGTHSSEDYENHVFSNCVSPTDQGSLWKIRIAFSSLMQNGALGGGGIASLEILGVTAYKKQRVNVNRTITLSWIAVVS